MNVKIIRPVISYKKGIRYPSITAFIPVAFETETLTRSPFAYWPELSWMVITFFSVPKKVQLSFE